jgi:hypothetical protein
MAGMCPLAVLTDQQKQVRFQRMLRKKGVVMSTTSNRNYLTTQMQNVTFGGIKRCSEEPTEMMTMRKKMPKMEPIYNNEHFSQLHKDEKEQMPPIKLIITKDRICKAERDEIVVSELTQTEDIIVWPQFLKSKIDFLEETFSRSFSKISTSDEDQIIMAKLSALQTGDTSVVLDNGEILRFVAKHVDQFQQFAQLQR